MSIDEQEVFLDDVKALSARYRLTLHVAAGFYAPNASPTCGPLTGRTLNIDNRGNLILCTVLAGFRGGVGDRERMFDLATGPVDDGLARLQPVVDQRNREHRSALEGCSGEIPLGLGSPCLDCLVAFSKVPAERFGTAAADLGYEQALRLTPAVVAQGDARGSTLYHPGARRRYELNETAAFLTKRLETGATIRDLTQALCGAYDVSESKAEQSVRAVVRRLEARGFVERVDQSPSPE